MPSLLEHYYTSQSEASEDDEVERRRNPSGLEDYASSTDGLSDTWARPPSNSRSAADREQYIRQLEELEAAEMLSNERNRHGLREGGGRALHDRTSKWKDRVNSSMATLRRDLDDLRERECTFQPAINRRSPRRPAAGDVYTRLYSRNAEAMERQRQQQESREAEEVADCTFRPRTVKSGWTAAVRPRYLDPQSHDETTLLGYAHRSDGGRASVSVRDEEPCTFAPVTNSTVSPYVAEYLRQPVHERLQSRASSSRAQRAESPNTSRRSLTPKQWRQFEERLSKDMERRQQRAESRRREVELERPAFQPRTTKYVPYEKLSEAEREKLAAERRRKQERERQRLEEEVYPRPPSRTPRRRSGSAKKDGERRPLIERFQEEAAKQLHKLEQKRAAREREELEAARRPENLRIARPPPDSTKEVVSVVARAQRGSLTTWRKFIDRVENDHEKEIQRIKGENQRPPEDAPEDLTFHPEVHDAPDYVKRIAAARSMSRHDTTHCSHHDTGLRRQPSGGIGPTSTGAMVLDPTPVRRF